MKLLGFYSHFFAEFSSGIIIIIIAEIVGVQLGPEEPVPIRRPPRPRDHCGI
jgi:hypothetical protein